MVTKETAPSPKAPDGVVVRTPPSAWSCSGSRPSQIVSSRPPRPLETHNTLNNLEESSEVLSHFTSSRWRSGYTEDPRVANLLFSQLFSFLQKHGMCHIWQCLHSTLCSESLFFEFVLGSNSHLNLDMVDGLSASLDLLGYSERIISEEQLANINTVTLRSCSRHLSQSADGANMDSNLPSFQNLLGSLIPRGEHSATSSVTLVTEETQPPGHRFLELIIYLCLNNFVGHESHTNADLYELLRPLLNKKFLEYMLSIRSPTSEALADTVFKLAVSAKDTDTAKMLLSSAAINPNEYIFKERYYPAQTPLQCACRLGCETMVKTLIDAGADVNKYCDAAISTYDSRPAISLWPLP
jgi:hypothetical protein